MSLVSPNSKPTIFKNNNILLKNDSIDPPTKSKSPTRKPSNVSLSAAPSANNASISPSKRHYLQQMSPNISNRTVHLPNDTPLKQQSLKRSSISSSNSGAGVGASAEVAADSSSTTTIKPIAKPTSKFQRPQLPPSLRPPINGRSKTAILPSLSKSTSSLTTTHSSTQSLSNPFILRRANSLISQGGSSSLSDLHQQQQSSTTSSDRFIPSRYNSVTGKLDTSNEVPLPNAAPEVHIKAQTSKIYQHHVAEACGLEMNSRILLYQPLPPERKKPVNLVRQLSNQSSSLTPGASNIPNSQLFRTSFLTKSGTLTPSAAAARANKIPNAPERVLDAPGLIDDFYLNLLAWSSTNLLAIGLEDAVYVWNASTGSVGLLCELADKTLVTSLRWSQDGSYISIGKDDGLIEIWDIESNSKLRTLNCDNHLTRIASQSWNQHVLTSGSRMGHIYFSDVRVANHLVNKNQEAHSAEICGIEYRPVGTTTTTTTPTSINDSLQFASGGNDNLVCIWDARNVTTPIFSKSNHKAAVKALSWCPYQSTLLATGGGSTDKTINFWNTTTGARVNTIETGSQISSLNWGYANGTGLEIVATHGFPSNSISLFNYPTLQKTGEIINAHDTRILNGCLSPDNLTLATVAGDENLKFWSLFDLYKNNKRDYNHLRHGQDRDNDYDDDDGVSDVNGLNNDDNDGGGHDSKRIKKMMNLR
ncbi:APC/C activator protein, putative [Candida dubliniensis CD36]|uniref:APC/C activator protein, putative n=1 Tax=Candida dubliniensis (strain CD36 / ATCC MYA-646 / CBS 7987 / NCPF 3949 / NRRL Y-17841) TaxID=573826 RepID=B9WIJ4_CANDC|nr:APC/C activator protein, putative [Candida dubliniensis CD36]CAX41059.1 APC/C activator protein, putative [Candida dubliniensis CD36]